MHGWIDPFYEPASRAIAPGHVWCDQPIYMPPRHGLKITRVNPQNDADLDYEVCGRTADTFSHPPIHSLRLESSEGLVVAQTKRNRPVIILGGTAATELRPIDTRHVETVFVVPVYGADQFDEQVRRRISYYEFTNAFYLPDCTRPQFDEGFARLDHAQAVSQSHLVNHRGLKLVSDALDALVEWFVAYATGRLPDDSIILEFRREMLASGGS